MLVSRGAPLEINVSIRNQRSISLFTSVPVSSTASGATVMTAPPCICWRSKSALMVSLWSSLAVYTRIRLPSRVTRTGRRPLSTATNSSISSGVALAGTPSITSTPCCDRFSASSANFLRHGCAGNLSSIRRPTSMSDTSPSCLARQMTRAAYSRHSFSCTLPCVANRTAFSCRLSPSLSSAPKDRSRRAQYMS